LQDTFASYLGHTRLTGSFFFELNKEGTRFLRIHLDTVYRAQGRDTYVRNITF
jgi:hypothetical protein